MTNPCDEVQNRAIICAPATAVSFHATRQTKDKYVFLIYYNRKTMCITVLLCSIYDLYIHHPCQIIQISIYSKKNEFLIRKFRHEHEKRLKVFGLSYGLKSLSNFCLHMGRVLFEKAVNKLSALGNTKVH